MVELFISCDALSDSIAKLSRARFPGGWGGYRTCMAQNVAEYGATSPPLEVKETCTQIGPCSMFEILDNFWGALHTLIFICFGRFGSFAA